MWRHRSSLEFRCVETMQIPDSINEKGECGKYSTIHLYKYKWNIVKTHFPLRGRNPHEDRTIGGHREAPSHQALWSDWLPCRARMRAVFLLLTPFNNSIRQQKHDRWREMEEMRRRGHESSTHIDKVRKRISMNCRNRLLYKPDIIHGEDFRRQPTVDTEELGINDINKYACTCTYTCNTLKGNNLLCFSSLLLIFLGTCLFMIPARGRASKDDMHRS